MLQHVPEIQERSVQWTLAYCSRIGLIGLRASFVGSKAAVPHCQHISSEGTFMLSSRSRDERTAYYLLSTEHRSNIICSILRVWCMYLLTVLFVRYLHIRGIQSAGERECGHDAGQGAEDVRGPGPRSGPLQDTGWHGKRGRGLWTSSWEVGVPKRRDHVSKNTCF